MKPESIIQRAVLRYLFARNVVCVAVPNGSHLAGDKAARIRQMAAMKADGLLVGFPDMILFHPVIASTAFVEIKTPQGRLSKEQKGCIDWLAGLGHKVAVIRSVDDMAEALREWGWWDGTVTIGEASARVVERLRVA